MQNAGLALLVQLGLGYLWQWARGPKKIPNWLSWVVFGLLAVGGWFWATPDALKNFHANWRDALYLLVSFVLASRGTAGTASDTKVAPKTNSK